MRETWRSSVYDHFQPPVVIEKRGAIYHRFVCKRCDLSIFCMPLAACLSDHSDPKRHCDRREYDASTGNLKRHVDDCDEDRDGQPRQQTIDNYAQGVTYTYARFRVKLAIWVARHHRPFVIVEDQIRDIVYLARILCDDATVAGDGCGSEFEVACDHEDSDARAAERSYDFWDFGPGRVDDCH